MSTVADEKKEFRVECYSASDFAYAVCVLEAMAASQKDHFGGPTLQELQDKTKLPPESVARALERLGTRDPDNGPIKVAFYQEGTAGPHAVRFARRPNVTMAFRIRNANGYRFEMG